MAGAAWQVGVLHCHYYHILMVKAAGVRFGLALGRPWPTLTGLLNSYHEVAKGAAFGCVSRPDR
jgi:hypothetical protein